MKALGDVYDVAVNVNDDQGSADVDFVSKTMALPGGAWSEGWHANKSLDYTTIGLSSDVFQPVGPSALAQTVESALRERQPHLGVHDSVWSGRRAPRSSPSQHDRRRRHRRSAGAFGATARIPFREPVVLA
jgi:hypothetical protein